MRRSLVSRVLPVSLLVGVLASLSISQIAVRLRPDRRQRVDMTHDLGAAMNAIQCLTRQQPVKDFAKRDFALPANDDIDVWCA